MTDEEPALHEDIPPHPLVVGLTDALDPASATGKDAQQTRADAKAAARDMATTDHARIGRMTRGTQAPSPGPWSLLTDVDFPRLSTFSGYLGNAVIQGDGTVWRLLYLDEKLWTWLLIQQDDIIFHDRIKDRNAAFGLRDVVWLDADATMGEGSGARSPQTRFLTGDFTSAGDFSTSLSGGTVNAATGIFCQAATPGCCTRPSRSMNC
jgi:hypothetical protein